MEKYRVAILGTGNIGTDLLVKIQRNPLLRCVAFVGKRLDSPGMLKAQSMGVQCFSDGIKYIQEHHKEIDLVIDCTNAQDHLIHAPILAGLHIKAIDMTPARVGKMCVPSINGTACKHEMNVNMITCGGQASLPLIHALCTYCKDVSYIEVVSSISSKSAGMGTRNNLDEYISTTEEAITKFTGVKNTKVILNINPAEPCVNMQTTIFMEATGYDVEVLGAGVRRIIQSLKESVPGYTLISGPFVENGKLVTIIRVIGQGDYLPPYAGNLDIINCAAIDMAERFARES